MLDKQIKHDKPNTLKIIHRLLAGAGLLFLCSCATQIPEQASVRPELPAPVPLDENTGRGFWREDKGPSAKPVLVKLHLEGGEELLFMVDTGAPGTTLDKSLEAKLGKRLRSEKLTYGWAEYGAPKAGVYAAPKLFLGNTPLQTGKHVYTDDLSRIWPGRPMMGVLGMDCLRHYCLQLDFSARELRFLDPDLPPDKNLGKAFPLTVQQGGYAFAGMDFFGKKNVWFMLDTAAYTDGALKLDLFQQALQKQESAWIQQWKPAPQTLVRVAYLPAGTLNGETYAQLAFNDSSTGTTESLNILGLAFLARNLVTLNFPKQMMHLKQESLGPRRPGSDFTFAANQFLMDLRKQGRMPGWLKEEHGNCQMLAEDTSTAFPVSRTFDLIKKGETGKYHYTLAQAARETPWKLQKAWQTDVQGHTIKEFPVQ